MYQMFTFQPLQTKHHTLEIRLFLMNPIRLPFPLFDYVIKSVTMTTPLLSVTMVTGHVTTV